MVMMDRPITFNGVIAPGSRVTALASVWTEGNCTENPRITTREIFQENLDLPGDTAIDYPSRPIPRGRRSQFCVEFTVTGRDGQVGRGECDSRYIPGMAGTVPLKLVSTGETNHTPVKILSLTPRIQATGPFVNDTCPP